MRGFTIDSSHNSDGEHVLKPENWHLTYRWAKRIAISIVGGTVLAIGVAMIVLPGPAFVVIPLGLAILGAEYAWARRWLRKVKERTAYYVARVKGADVQAAVAPAPVGEPPSPGVAAAPQDRPPTAAAVPSADRPPTAAEMPPQPVSEQARRTADRART